MSEAEAVQITDASGLTFKAWLKSASSEEGNPQVLLQLDDGTQFLVPSDLLAPDNEGRYLLKVSLREHARNPESALPAGSNKNDADTVIALAEETLRVGKRTLERGRVQVTKRVVEREETVDLPLLQEQVEVERIPINRVVEQAAPVRYEGDTTIIPLYEEVLVFSKQLLLVEEVRVTRHRSERRDPQRVTVRREEAVVERSSLDAGDELSSS